MGTKKAALSERLNILHQQCQKHGLAELVDMLCQTRLQVCSFVSVDDVGLGQLVQHLLYHGELLSSLVLVSGSAELANSVTHRLCIVLVMQSLHLGLANSLY